MSTMEEGGIRYEPIPGEMLRLAYDAPQVEVFVENFASKCTDDCSFQWNDDLTPNVTAISPTSGEYHR